MIFCVISFYLIKTFNVKEYFCLINLKTKIYYSVLQVSYHTTITVYEKTEIGTEQKKSDLYSSSLLKIYMCYNLTGVLKTFGTKMSVKNS